ncbi:MAG TPA: hypothetical protein VGX78_06760, partial [Pirellulales bacterium]|nr:hypothetical protein [Pirellulales bacterium]
MVIGALSVALRNRAAHAPPVAKARNDAAVGDNHGAEKRFEGFWQEDDVQYYAPGPEAAAMKAAKASLPAEGADWAVEGDRLFDGARMSDGTAKERENESGDMYEHEQVAAERGARERLNRDLHIRQEAGDQGGGSVGSGQRRDEGTAQPESGAGMPADPKNGGEPSDREWITKGHIEVPGTDPNGIVAPSESNAESKNSAERKPQSSIKDMGFDGRKKKKNAKSSDRN